MVSVHDVAAFILREKGEMTAMKLQKLVYYSQAWSLVWDEAPLFAEHIEAWANGPVCPDLYQIHRGTFLVTLDERGDAAKVTGEAADTVRSVLQFYGDKSPQWLSNLTHEEDPWKRARAGLQAGERGNVVITLDSMYAYYAQL